MKILMIGGTGTLSSDVTRLCIERKLDVYLLNRGHSNAFSASNVHYLLADINKYKNVLEVLGSEKFDVVIDFLTYNVETIKDRIRIFKKRTKQYIFISSATVYPINDRPICENDVAGNDGWIYARNKKLCEEYLMKNCEDLTFKYTIVRPYVTYDRRRIPFPVIPKQACWNLIYRIENQLPILMPGDGNQRVTLTSTKDFAVGLVGLFQNPKAYGEDFNIVGEMVVTWNDVLHEIEKRLHKEAMVVYVDTIELAKRIPTISEELLCDKAYSHIFNNEKIKSAVLDFKTTIDLETGMKEVVDYLMADAKFQKIDLDWNAMEDVICAKYGNKQKKIKFMQMLRYIRKQSKTIIGIKKILWVVYIKLKKFIFI